MNNVFFISGIDTNIGKTYATGMLAKALAQRGKRVITQKLVQTGCTHLSEDILTHRHLQGIPLTEEDQAGWTCPYIFTYPCSPHMAAERDQRAIDFHVIEACTQALSQRYDIVLLEGAGGLMVPLTRSLLTLDYVAEKGWPLILVTSGKLGSINHTMLSLEAAKRHGLELKLLMFNLYPQEEDTTISDDTQKYIQDYLASEFPDAEYMTVPLMK